MLPFNMTVMRKIHFVEVRDGQYILIEHLVELGDDDKHPPTPPPITQAPPPPSHSTGPSSSYPSHIEATLQYHTKLLYWVVDSLSTLCQ